MCSSLVTPLSRERITVSSPTSGAASSMASSRAVIFTAKSSSSAASPVLSVTVKSHLRPLHQAPSCCNRVSRSPSAIKRTWPGPSVRSIRSPYKMPKAPMPTIVTFSIMVVSLPSVFRSLDGIVPQIPPGSTRNIHSILVGFSSLSAIFPGFSRLPCRGILILSYLFPGFKRNFRKSFCFLCFSGLHCFVWKESFPWHTLSRPSGT